MQCGLHVVFRNRKAWSHKLITMDEFRLSDGDCILVEGYVVQFILFYPLVFRRRHIFFIHICMSRSIFPWNKSRTPQQNQLKFSCTCLEMLLRTSHTDQVRISLCGVFCIFRFLLWCQTYILWP